MDTDREIRRQILAAQRAGPSDETVEPISASKIDDPIEFDFPAEPSVDSLVVIKGYQILSELSHGGQATVYLARNEMTNRKVAVKVMIGGPFLNTRARVRFEREVEALAKLDHPGIVGILDRGRTADGSFFLVTQFIDGLPLDDYLDKARLAGLMQQDVINLFVKIADAVQEAHKHGIVHRDLKPSNVLVDSRGDPHVLDFGLARFYEIDPADTPVGRDLTVTGNVIGTISWASPEQARGDTGGLRPQSDVYSLGVMLYHALAGQFPYIAIGAILDVTHNICHTAPVPLVDVATPPFGQVHPWLWQIVLNTLAKNQSTRPENAGKLVELLDCYLQGRNPLLLMAQPAWWRKWVAPTIVALLLFAGVWVITEKYLPADSPVLVFALPQIKNSIGMELVRISSGRFQMGGGPEDLTSDGLLRGHTVVLNQPFFIARTEVSRGQYRQVMGGLPSDIPAIGGDNLPVDHISRDDAEEFCRKLSASENKVYRLPTEAEWEYACAAQKPGAYSGTGKINDMGWSFENSNTASIGTLRPVAGKQANAYGLYDTHGNAAEWCADGYRRSFGLQTQVNPFNPPAGLDGVLRGGSVYELADACRTTSRRPLNPASRRAGVGFRVVMDVPAAPVK